MSSWKLILGFPEVPGEEAVEKGEQLLGWHTLSRERLPQLEPSPGLSLWGSHPSGGFYRLFNSSITFVL